MMVVIHKLIENIQCFKQRIFFHGPLSLVNTQSARRFILLLFRKFELKAVKHWAVA